MNNTLALTSLLLAALATPLAAATAVPDTTTTYRVRQTVKLTEIPAGAKQVKWWISIPDDDRHQDVLDLTVASAPGAWRIVTEPDRANRFLYVEVANPGSSRIARARTDRVPRRAAMRVRSRARASPLAVVRG